MPILRKQRESKGLTVNKKWATNVSYEEFKKDSNIAKLTEKDARALYDFHNEKQVEKQTKAKK